MSRGREIEVPHLVMEALRRTELRGCRKSSRHARMALAIIEVGFSSVLIQLHLHLGVIAVQEDAERVICELVEDIHGYPCLTQEHAVLSTRALR